MSKIRNRIISNKIFQKLWNEAAKIDELKEYIHIFAYAGSKDYINFKKIGLEYDEFLVVLKEIHQKNHLTFKEIIDMAGKRKCEIAATFCIPIRTIEEWYSGNNKCSPYMKLVFIRYYHLLNLGKYIYVEAEQEYESTKKRKYKTSNITKR